MGLTTRTTQGFNAVSLLLSVLLVGLLTLLCAPSPALAVAVLATGMALCLWRWILSSRGPCGARQAVASVRAGRDGSYCHETVEIFNASAPLCLIGKNHDILRVNDAFASFFGVAIEEARGKKCHEIWRSALCWGSQCALLEILEGAERTEHTLEIEMHPGDRRFCVVTAMPYRDPSGAVVGLVESFVDITELREAQKQILNAAESEQRRVGRDVHDGLVQHLSGIAYMAQVIARRLKENGSEEAQPTEEIAHLLHDSVSQARRLARGLCPEVLATDGIVPGLRELTRFTEKLYDIPCETIVSAPESADGASPLDTLDTTVQTHLYRIAQEAVNNAVRHASPTRVLLRIGVESEAIVLVVEDDGKGVPEPRDTAKGMGLRSMEYRAKLIGAAWTVEPRPDGGTIVRCVLRP